MKNIVVVRRTQAADDIQFSILIPSWNNLPYLQLCIESIRKHSLLHNQIIVHINEGIDGTLDWVKQQSDIDYSYSKENIGVCFALNVSRTLVATDYILYMNDDMFVCPGWDKLLMDEVKQVGHKLFFISGTAIEPVSSSNCVIEKDYGRDISTFREGELLETFASLEKYDWQGATWPPNVVHRDVWDLVGGYSTEFSPGMYSDPDFSMKLWKAGVRLYKGVSNSRVYHFGSKSTKRIKKNRGYYTFISKWGITSSTLTKVYLRRGQRFDGPLGEPVTGSGLKIKNLIKRLAAAMKF
ncbi:MAG: glycosyltransferase [Flavitalea sp.]